MPRPHGQTEPHYLGLAVALPDELFTTPMEAADVRAERIVSHGHASPAGLWYDQVRHEWVAVLKGPAIKPGDFVNIPAHQKPRVEGQTPDEPAVWLAVFHRG